MARISRLEKERNLETFNQLILDIFLTEGWDHVTYDRLSKELHLRKSTLQGYYPSNVHFAQALQGKVMPLVLRELDFSSREGLISSWQSGLKIRHFRMIIAMFVTHSVKPELNLQLVNIVKSLMKQIKANLPNEEIKPLIQLLLGIAVTEFIGI